MTQSHEITNNTKQHLFDGGMAGDREELLRGRIIVVHARGLIVFLPVVNEEGDDNYY
jgi:hypothetical protein